MGLLNKKHYSRFPFINNNDTSTTNNVSRKNKKKCNVLEQQQQHAGLLKGNTTMQNSNEYYRMVINKNQDDEMEICCYKSSPLKTAFTYFFLILTCGLLRLVFHWIPQWYVLATCRSCGVNEAQQVLITENFRGGKHKIYHVKSILILTPDSLQKLKDQQNVLNSHQICNDDVPYLSVHYGSGEFRQVDKLIYFKCKKITYIWDAERQEFMKLHGLDHGISADLLHKNKGLTVDEQFLRQLVYGPNKILVEEASILKLLFLEVLNPFYIFQVGSFILWFLDNYYYYAATILIMSVFGISMTVRQIRKNQRNLKSTVHSTDVCTIQRRLSKKIITNSSAIGDNDDGEIDDLNCYKTEVISTDLLVPGDVLEIPSHGCIMHCDALLLTGTCIVNESMLTGESVPVTKIALPNLSDLLYDQKEHSRHTLFCGTKIIQTRYFGNEKVLAVVIRTGFSTAKGSLVRSILYPPPVDFRFEKDSYRFVILLACVACIGFTYTIITKFRRGVPLGDIVIEAFDLITIVVPPALPAAMTVGRFYAQIRLQKQSIFCISPRTINVSGSIDCVCFDKTGTLTEDGLDLLCVVPIINQTFHQSVSLVESLPYNVFVCGLVSCHSLTIIDKQIVGDPLDLKMFESTKWTIEEHEVADNNKFNMIYPTVLKPPKNRHHTNNIIKNNTDDNNTDLLQIGIIREFPFSSSLQRMGVIIRKLNGQHFEYYCKGSPEMLLNYVDQSTVPHDFHTTLETYTQKGYRVIAIAHKQLKLSYMKVLKVQRDVLEMDMKLLGLIVLENRLKIDTMPSIQALNDADIRVIMVTGDNILTAISVARECDLIRHNQSVITVHNNVVNNDIYYTLTNMNMMMKNQQLNDQSTSILSNSASIVSLDTIESQIQNSNSVAVPTNRNNNNNNNNAPNQLSLFNNYRFALTGKVWDIVKEYHPELIPRLVTRGSVFARMSPEQKQQLVEELQNLGYCVAMCGDGANDCGALKAAHTGISLSEAESSVASPFTSKNPNITCVLSIIKEGRAALVTSFGIFKYMAAYSLCQFVSVLILYSIDSNLTDLEFLYIDLFIISIFAFFFGRNEAYSGKLVKETPLSSLMSFSPILSLVLQMILVVAFQLIAFEHLKYQDWYELERFDPGKSTYKDDVGCIENYVIYTVSSFQYIILALVFSKGKPYRNSIFTNYGFILSALVITSFSIYLTLCPAEFLREQFELILPEHFRFRVYLLFYAIVHFALSLFIEHVIIDNWVFKKLRFKFHNIDKSKRKYLAIERDINADTKWPVLTSDYRSAASPLTHTAVNDSGVQCTAEIVVEKENKFDKNHILNKLYYSQDSDNNLSPESRVVVSSPLMSTSSSETFQSFGGNNNNSGNTTYDLANSHTNIDELPFDGVVINNSPIKNNQHIVLTINNDNDNDNDNDDDNLSSFNALGNNSIMQSHPHVNTTTTSNYNKDFEMDNFDDNNDIS